MKNLILIQPNGILKKFYPRAVWNMDRSQKKIYLTFDDGPIPGLTEWVLDELKKFQVKATFFCVGANILKHPKIFERIIREGHAVANHTMSHIKGFKHTVSEYMREVDECAKLVGNSMFRPPYGQLKRSQYKALIQRGYKIILWDIISYDYETISGERCLSNAIRGRKNGSIVIFHDNLKAEKNIRYALPLFLEDSLKNGFTFENFFPVQDALAL
jgi:peptidoglycan-N-acetylglucosamine deacetylase